MDGETAAPAAPLVVSSLPLLLHRILLPVLCIVFLLLAGYRVTAPWIRGDEGYAGAQHQAIARHQLRHGLLQIRFAQFRVFHEINDHELFDGNGCFRGEDLRDHYGDRFWTSRLPFGVLPHTFAMVVFGDSEWAMRLVPIGATLLLILAAFCFVRTAYGSTPALCCAVVLALTPGTILNARLAGHEMPLLLLVILTLFFYDRYRHGLAQSFTLVWGVCLLAGLMGWFGLFLVPILFLESLRACPAGSVSWRQRLSLLLIPVAVLGLYVVYLYALGQSLEERLGYFWNVRSLGATAKFSIFEFLYRIQKYWVNHITPLPLLLCAGWISLYIRSRRADEKMKERRLILMAAAFGLCCYVFAVGSAYVHRYYILWWLPFICLAAGFFVSRIQMRLSQRWRLAFAVVLVAGLISTSAYKVWRQGEKEQASRPMIALAKQASEALTASDHVCVMGVGETSLKMKGLYPAGFWKSKRAPYYQMGLIHDTGAPSFFYLWHRSRHQAFYSILNKKSFFLAPPPEGVFPADGQGAFHYLLFSGAEEYARDLHFLWTERLKTDAGSLWRVEHKPESTKTKKTNTMSSREGEN